MILYPLTEVEIQQIRKYPENQDWNTIACRADLPEDFIIEFIDYFNLDCLLSYQKLSENLIISIKEKFNNEHWFKISFTDNLSENFIREFQNKVDWYWIAANQNLSKEFIVEFSNKINFYGLSLNENMSDDIKEFCRMFL